MLQTTRRRHRTEAQEQLRQLNLRSLPALAIPGVLFVVVDGHSWFHVLVLGLTTAVAIYAFIRWADFQLEGWALPMLAFTAVLWPIAALLLDAPNAYFSLALVSSLVIPQLPRRRVLVALAVVLYVLLVSTVVLLQKLGSADFWALAVAHLLTPALVTGVAIGAMFPNERLMAIVRELEESRRREAELAVARERIRFAGDLHDIQGHTLHVVKLKTTLAQKLVRLDPQRAEEELQEIHALVSDTIAQTKELAHAQRRLNLAAELENAKNLFEAAGIRVRIVRRAEADPRAVQMLSQVLRESTTNILRHAQAREVRITLSQVGISVDNDGAIEPPGELRGLDTLRKRLEDDGGELSVEWHDGRFVTSAKAFRFEERQN